MLTDTGTGTFLFVDAIPLGFNLNFDGEGTNLVTAAITVLYRTSLTLFSNLTCLNQQYTEKKITAVIILTCTGSNFYLNLKIRFSNG
jgi:hypothetical protein